MTYLNHTSQLGPFKTMSRGRLLVSEIGGDDRVPMEGDMAGHYHHKTKPSAPLMNCRHSFSSRKTAPFHQITQIPLVALSRSIRITCHLHAPTLLMTEKYFLHDIEFAPHG